MAVTAAAVVVLALILVASRNLIAKALARSWLKGQGVTSALEVRSLSLTGLKARLKLGDPAAPDLTVDEVDVDYAITGPWNGQRLGVVTRAVRLVRPDVVVRWDGHRLTYGALTRVVDDFLKRPADPNRPPPQVVIEDGLVHLATPYGLITAKGDALIDHGALMDFQGHIDPAHLSKTGGDLGFSTPGGPVSLTRRGQTLALQANLPVDAARFATYALTQGKLSLSGTLPASATGAGAIALTADASAQTLTFPGGTTQQVSLHATFDGTGQAQLRQLKASGHAKLQAGAASVAGPRGRLETAAANLDLPQLAFTLASGQVSASGAGQGAATIGALSVAGARARGVSTQVRIAKFDLASGAAHPWRAQIASVTHLDQAAASGLTLTDARLNADGAVGADGVILTGGLQAHGGADAAMARRLAQALSAADPAYGAALAQAIRDVRIQAAGLRLQGRAGAFSLAAGSPLRLTSASGAVATVTPRAGAPLVASQGGGVRGAFDLALNGGGLPTVAAQASDWRVSAGAATATLSARTTVNLGPAKDVVLQAAGTARLAAGGASFALAGCAPVLVGALAMGGNTVSNLSGQVCPGGAPLIQTSAKGWRSTGRFEGVRADLAPTGLKLSGGAGRFDLVGAGGGLTGAVDLTTLTAADTTAVPRFRPQSTRGRLTFAGRTLGGRFSAFTPGGLDLATVTLAHDLKTGIGHADIDAHGLIFAKGGLQPAILTPLAAFAKDAQGPVTFQGRFDWTNQGVTSHGVIGTPGLTFKSPLGVVTAIKGQVQLTSLAPLVSAPDQSLTIERIDAVAPIDSVTATFDFNGQALTLDTAQAQAAKGRVSLEPMQIPLSGDGPIQGALVLDHVDLGDLLATSSLADSVKVQMVVIGRLPFEFGPGGFHFLQGHISAVQPGRISISRKALSGLQTGAGAASSTGPAANAVQDLAYEALENLSFDTLEADVASRPGGRLGMIFAIKGHYDPPVKQQATFKLSELLNGQAFQKKIPLPSDTPINLNLDTSLNFDELITALANIWKHDTAPKKAAPASGSVPVQ